MVQVSEEDRVPFRGVPVWQIVGGKRTNGNMGPRKGVEPGSGT